MVRSTKFSAVPPPPLEGLDFSLYEKITSLKQNVELLTGQRKELDDASRALTPASVTVAELDNPKYVGSTAAGIGFTVSGVRVPSYNDYNNLLTDVRNLANDVESLRTSLNTLISQLRN
jgi:hypothetical protein